MFAERSKPRGANNLGGGSGSPRGADGGRRPAFEPLEPRRPLAAAGLVDVGSQPEGSLSGKIVYVHGGHGYTTIDNGTASAYWSYQRPLLLGMVEDLGNQDQMSLLADYLWRAGATVVPLRPVGHQPAEVVLDNDAPEVSFAGAWSNSTSSVFFGSAGDVPYRYATAAATETAVARYRPNLPSAGFYPVYAWTLAGSDRASDQLYRINHAGGSTEVTVNHRRVGGGLVYLGTYSFAAGSGGSVEISNRSSEPGRVVIADMIRFGNGMGDTNRGAGKSGLAREDETGLYWIKWHVDRSRGIPESEYRATSDDSSASVSFSPRYAEYMNREADGRLADRVFVSFHSNAGGGSARGVIGLYNGNNDPASATPNQLLLARTLAQEVNNDLVALNGSFEHDWYNRGTSVVLDRSDIEFGEINNYRIGGEFDATIVEVGFHDNQQDAELMRDARVRDAVARATYQGIVRYFRAVDGGATPLVMAPPTVDGVRAEPTGWGQIRVAWTPPVASGAAGDAATGYRVYASIDGYAFDGGTYVAGGATTSLALGGLDPQQAAYVFRVAAVNAGGESPLSEAVAASPQLRRDRVLIVGGFDRLERRQNPVQQVGSSGFAERVRARQSNSRDYAGPTALAVAAALPSAQISTAANEAVVGGAVSLNSYAAVVWLLGEESTADDTFDPVEQQLVAQYLATGGKLLASGAEIGWDLDAQNNGRAFFNTTLKADYVADDANSYSVRGVAGSPYAGLNFGLDDGRMFYNVDFPDVVAPLGGASLALTYANGSGAGVVHADPVSGARRALFAFPVESILDPSLRRDVLARTMAFFQLGLPQPDFNGSGAVEGRDLLAWQRGFGIAGGAQAADGDADGDARVDAQDRTAWEAAFGVGAGAAVAAARAPAESGDPPAPLSATAAEAAVPGAASRRGDMAATRPDVRPIAPPPPADRTARGRRQEPASVATDASEVLRPPAAPPPRPPLAPRADATPRLDRRRATRDRHAAPAERELPTLAADCAKTRETCAISSLSRWLPAL